MIPRLSLFRMRSYELIEPFIPVGASGIEPLPSTLSWWRST